jgi:hypothetical protein
MSRMIVIHRMPSFICESGGNGFSARLENVAERRDVFFQGEDANAFLTTLEGFELVAPTLAYEKILSELWRLYAEVSQPIEGA